ncbi:clusterin associated protein [Tritrichomonas foetus]|uniref:Clusterin associated protein n=1 Tax=Tritrichomonas foetus TaxID=1144522 RepID=A0A1J4J8D2_9EUKA|nr:clusterin associated protein [Tritrichomonas foetus]|eukprot:OHS95450.1 clusterin associated protein [Tritrichomonas foetus]
MTFREIKQFTEIVRTLGYPKAVGVDSFDTPNFGMMADLLHWLCSLFDPDIVILSDLSSESSRVEFIRSIVQQMAIKSGIRMNPRKLYGADRFAVREMLKVAAPIYKGVSATLAINQIQHENRDQGKADPPSAKKISQLSASVPKHSVELYDELDKELMIRAERMKILSTMPPLDAVEKNVLSAVDSAATRLDTLQKELERLSSDEAALQTKIKQRKHEYDRQSKRLMSVQTIRPAFMDEYEGLEQELAELFKVHFQHYRNIDYFSHELSLQEQKKKKILEQKEKELKKFRNKIRQNLVVSVINSVNNGGGVEANDDALFQPQNDNSDSDDSF